MGQSVCPSSRSPKALEMNLLEAAATAVTPYLLGAPEGNLQLASGPTLSPVLGQNWGKSRVFRGVCAHLLLLRLFPPLARPQVGTEPCVSPVGAAHCLRIASAPPGRLEREPVAMVTTRLQTSGKDELVAGCGLLASRCHHVTGTWTCGSVFLFHGEMCHLLRWAGWGQLLQKPCGH